MKSTSSTYKKFFVYALFVFLLGGCATIKPSALNQGIQSINISQESIALLSIKVSNKYKPSYQPKIMYVFVWENGKDDNKKYSFKVEDPYKEIENEYNEYLISFQLKSGKYKLRELFAQSGIFPVRGTFSMPIYSVFEIEANKIIYLGHIEASIKEKTKNDELRAGPVIPLIDQAVTGASGGTFVIEITDLFKNDIDLFKKQYPYLSSYNIENRTLPQWKKPTEQDMQ